MPAATIHPFVFHSYAGEEFGNNLLTSNKRGKKHHPFPPASFPRLFRADLKKLTKKAAALM